jgi:hypothetical protein
MKAEFLIEAVLKFVLGGLNVCTFMHVLVLFFAAMLQSSC